DLILLGGRHPLHLAIPRMQDVLGRIRGKRFRIDKERLPMGLRERLPAAPAALPHRLEDRPVGLLRHPSSIMNGTQQAAALKAVYAEVISSTQAAGRR